MTTATNGHRAPWDCVYAKDEGDDCRPGERPGSDQGYFEVMCLALLQAGLNWASIRKHWPRYRRGFLGFAAGRLAGASAEELMQSPDVIRNARKVEAIIHNAREFRDIARQHGSFAAYLETLRPLPEKERLKSFTRRFKQIGPEAGDYFLHAVGFDS